MGDLILRELEKAIETRLMDQKAIIILGSRQTGKTTLLKSIFQDQKQVISIPQHHKTIVPQYQNTT